VFVEFVCLRSSRGPSEALFDQDAQTPCGSETRVSSSGAWWFLRLHAALCWSVRLLAVRIPSTRRKTTETFAGRSAPNPHLRDPPPI